MKRKLPELRSDDEAEAFLETADLSDYDLSGLVPLTYEFQPKEARVTMRLPSALIKAVKAEAARVGMPYQRYIRRVLEASLEGRH